MIDNQLGIQLTMHTHKLGKNQKGSIDHKLQILGALGLLAGGAIVVESNGSVGGLLLLTGGGWFWVLVMKEIFGWESKPKTLEGI